MVVRVNPVAPATMASPPYPTHRDSVAAHSLRARSSSSGWSERYFRRIAASTSTSRLITIADDGVEAQVALRGQYGSWQPYFLQRLNRAAPPGDRMRRSRLNDSVVAGQRRVHSARMSWTRWSLCVLLVACEAPPPSAPSAPASTSARASAAPARSANAVDCSDFCRCWRNCSPYQQEDPCPQCKKAGCASTRCGASE
jgi:hypothetical protein